MLIRHQVMGIYTSQLDKIVLQYVDLWILSWASVAFESVDA